MGTEPRGLNVSEITSFPATTAQALHSHHTSLAARLFPAVHLAVLDDQGVVFVEQGDIRRQVLHKKGPHFFVVRSFGKEARLGEEPPGVSIHYERRLMKRIEKDRIGRLPADPPHPQEFLPQLTPIPLAQLFQITAGTGKEP